MTHEVLVRYGSIPEVEKFPLATSAEIKRGACVILKTERGLEPGELLQDVPADSESVSETEFSLLREADQDDQQLMAQLRDECETRFDLWRKRIEAWELELELIELDLTLDQKLLILYVLNDRGPDCTKLALRAVAEGLETIKVVPVGPEGPVAVAAPSGGGCGSGGCGSGGCSH